MNVEASLQELKFPSEAYRIVALLPLVYVAWTDGKVQEAKRTLILEIARTRGLLDRGGEASLQTIAAALDFRGATKWHARLHSAAD
jgi:hypothetical protein